jgi:uncharacterized RDD family membrane protein YckC
MSDVSQGPGWWQASDGKWYPPEQAAGAAPTSPPPAGPPSGFGPPSGPPAGYGPPAGGPGGYGPPGPGGYGAPAGAGYGAPVGGSQGALAEWPQRAQAAVIDWFGPFLLAGILIRVSPALGYIADLLALAWALYNGYLQGENGQSTGKKVAGLRLVGENTGQPIGGGQGVLRMFAHFIDAIICYIGFLFPLWDSKKQTIADKIMKSVVITTPKA